MRSYGLVLVLTFSLTSKLHAQIEKFGEPSVTYTHKVNDFWSYTGQIAAYQSPEVLERVEGSLFGIRRLTPSTSVGLGYLNRQITPLESKSDVEHRFTFQLSHQSVWGIHQITQRVRAEERIRPSGNVHRFRYRAGVRTPLQGERLDPGERYLLTQNEVLGSFSDNPFSGENRISAHLGFLLQNRQRIEVGLQHRAERLFTDRDVNHVLILSTVWHFAN